MDLNIELDKWGGSEPSGTLTKSSRDMREKQVRRNRNCMPNLSLAGGETFVSLLLGPLLKIGAIRTVSDCRDLHEKAVVIVTACNTTKNSMLSMEGQPSLQWLGAKLLLHVVIPTACTSMSRIQTSLVTLVVNKTVLASIF